MTLYFWLSAAALALGLALLLGGIALKDKLKPRAAAAVILTGAAMTMLFLNLTLILYATALRGGR